MKERGDDRDEVKESREKEETKRRKQTGEVPFLSERRGLPSKKGREGDREQRRERKKRAGLA